MKSNINMVLSILAFSLLIACDPKGKAPTTGDTPPTDSTHEAVVNQPPSQEAPTTKEAPAVRPHHFICYANDANAAMAISIGFDEADKALQVKYKGQKEAMTLAYIKEEFQAGGAHPNIETYYAEMYEGKENGVYKLTHSGVWDYAEYTRGRDGKVFNFTIDHDLTIENDGYRPTPCF